MALEGTLRDFSLPDIFQLIGIQRKTGILTLKNEDEMVTVSFVEGSVVSADSLRKRLEDQLGSVLVKAGHITDSQLESALKAQRETLKRLGHVLIDNKYISSQDLRHALQLQVTQVIYRLFRWKDGEYHFSQEEKVDYDRENFTPISAENILMEGVRMVDEWPMIEKKIHSAEMVFRKADLDQGVEVDEAMSLIEEDMDFHLGEGGEEEEKSSPAADPEMAIRLSREEGCVYNLVDGRLNIQGIVDRSRMGEFDVYRVLFELLNRNLITEAINTPAAAMKAARKGVPGSGLLVRVAAVVLAVACLGTVARQVHAMRPLWPLAGQEGKSWAQIQMSIGHSQLERLGFAIKVYYLAFGASPDSLDELLERGLIRSADMIDPWGREFHYLQMDGGYVLAAYDRFGDGLDSELRLLEALPGAGVVRDGAIRSAQPVSSDSEMILLE